MGLTCSLLGHARDTPETEREREERGDEVVVVTREVRECTRCGDRTVVSENTEVRPVRDSTGDDGTPDPSPDDAADPASAGSGGDAVVPDAESDPSAADDDGVILEGREDADTDDRAPGEWPSADTGRDTRTPTDGPDVAEAAGAAETDPGIEDDPDGDGGTAAPGDGTGPSPEPVADVTAREWPDEGPAETSTPEGTGITAAERAETPDTGETVFVCPSCEFRESAAGSSHRTGDICPDCREGYLAERTRN